MAALVAVALIWGGALSASSAALEGVAAVQQVALRFAVAALTLAAALPGARRNVSGSTLIRGLGLGILLATGFLLQTCALETTPVVTSAFLTGTVVVFAPVIAMVWGGAGLSGRAVTGVLLATTGLALITLRGVGVGVGEAMTLAAALAWAVHLVALQRWGRPGEALPLALIQVASVASLAWALAAFQGSTLSVPRSAGHAVLVAGLGAVGTAAALVLLTWAQARVDATTAAVVLTLEPVFGATCAWAILGESLTPTVAVGATAVVTAMLLTVRDVPREHAPRPVKHQIRHNGTQKRHRAIRGSAAHRPTRIRPSLHHLSPDHSRVTSLVAGWAFGVDDLSTGGPRLLRRGAGKGSTVRAYGRTPMSRRARRRTSMVRVTASSVVAGLVIAGCTGPDDRDQQPSPSRPAFGPMDTRSPDVTGALGWRLGSYLEVEGERTPTGGGTARTTALGEVVAMDAWTRLGSVHGRFAVDDHGSFVGTEVAGRIAWVDVTDPATSSPGPIAPAVLEPLGEPVATTTLNGGRVDVHVSAGPAWSTQGSVGATIFESWIGDDGEPRRVVTRTALLEAGGRRTDLLSIADRADDVEVRPPYVSRGQALPAAAALRRLALLPPEAIGGAVEDASARAIDATVEPAMLSAPAGVAMQPPTRNGCTARGQLTNSDGHSRLGLAWDCPPGVDPPNLDSIQFDPPATTDPPEVRDPAQLDPPQSGQRGPLGSD